jgi:hypothetical protein
MGLLDGVDDLGLEPPEVGGTGLVTHVTYRVARWRRHRRGLSACGERYWIRRAPPA